MVGILIVTHGAFGGELIKSVELIIGEQKKVLSLSLKHGDEIKDLANAASQAIETLDDGTGVLVFVDLFGGSPSNTVGALLRRKNLECITGVNMAMLIEATDNRQSMSLTELKEACLQAGQAAIFDLRNELSLRQ